MNFKNECALQEFKGTKVGFQVTLCHINPIETGNTSTLQQSIVQTKQHLNSLYHRISTKGVTNPFKVSQCYLP